MEIGYLQEVKAIVKSLVLSCPNAVTVDALNRDYRSTEGSAIPYRKLGFQTIEAFLRSIPDAVQVCGSGPTASVHAVRNDKSEHIHEMVCQQKKAKRAKGNGSRPRQQPNNFRSQAPARRQNVSDDESVCNIRFGYPTVRNVQRNYINHQAQNAPIPVQLHHTFNNNTNKNLKSIRPQLQNPSGPQLRNSNVQAGSLETCARFMRNCTIQDDTCENTKNKVKTRPFPNVLKPHEEERKPCTESTNQNCKIELVQCANEEQTIIKIKPPIHINGEQKKSPVMPKALDVFHTTPNEESTLVNDMDEAVPEFAANNLVFRIDFPENTMTFGKKIPPYKLPGNVQRGSIIGVFISEIHSPFKFWFHIYKEHHELDTLMLQIERFYTSLDEDIFCIPRACICPGQVCAALFKGLWHRAEILSTVIKDRAKVLFVDYGTVSDVLISEIKFLLTAFATLPKQAIRGSLSHIRPTDLHWSQAAIYNFLSMSCDLMLYGQVSEIDKTTRTIYMVLCDTNSDEVVQVNKKLVENGFAFYDEEWQKTDKEDQRLHHLREDFPTFSMLEMGEYPSFAELVDLQTKGIDYEWIIDHNVYHPGRLDLHDNVPEAIRKLPFPLLTTNPFRCDIIMQLQNLPDTASCV